MRSSTRHCPLCRQDKPENAYNWHMIDLPSSPLHGKVRYRWCRPCVNDAKRDNAHPQALHTVDGFARP